MDAKEEKVVITTHKEEALNKSLDEIVNLKAEYERQRYNVSSSMTLPHDLADNKITQFDVAAKLSTSGIGYMSTLKVKNAGTYDEAKRIVLALDQQGFDCTVTAQLKINETSVVDFDKINSWTDVEGAQYKVTPKAKSAYVEDLRSFYNALRKDGYDPTIDIKAKKASKDDDLFATQLAAYPEGTVVTLMLKDAEV